MDKTHPNTGNQHAKKDDPKTSFLHIRVRQNDKARWVHHAQKKNQKLAAWVEEQLNKAAPNFDQ